MDAEVRKVTRALLEAAPGAAALLSADGVRVIDCNAGWSGLPAGALEALRPGLQRVWDGGGSELVAVPGVGVDLRCARVDGVGVLVTVREESLRDFHELLDSVNDGFCTLDREWKLTGFNRRFQVASGLQGDDLLGQSFLDLYFSQERERSSELWQQLHRAMNERVPVAFEGYYEPRDTWSECHVLPRRDGGLALYYSDITARRKTEQRLELEQHKLEVLFAQAPAAMALWRGPDLVYERVNPAYQAIFGERPLVGKPLVEALPEMEGQPFVDLILHVLHTGEPFVAREMQAQLGGRDYFFNYVFTRVLDPLGEPYGVFNHAVDVTDHVTARLDLARSQEQLARAVAVSRVGFYEWSSEDGLFRFSEQMQRDWMLGPSNTMAELEERFHPEDRERHRAYVRSTAAVGEPYRDQVRVVHPDGKVVWMELHGRVLVDEAGVPTRLFGTNLDISQTKEREAELEAARQLAERANETKSAFLANMSHEIRTPLGAILGFSELLKTPGLDDEDRSQFLDTITRNGEALTRIIDDILDLAKVEAGKLRVEEAEFSLGDLAREVLALFEGRGLSLELKGSERRVRSDAARVRQILINLVGNAVKFTERGGVTVTLGEVGGLVTVSVHDTGPGIPEEQRAGLFQPFVQADNSSTRRHGGTGLGLALSRRLARALGGDVRLEASDSGSLFVLSFRAEAVHEVTTPPAAAGSSPTLDGLSVLVVDDSADNRTFVEKLLHRSGAQVALAVNGDDGMRRALGGDFDVVLMDLQMPVMDGLAATRALRAAGYTRPIVALTAHAMTEERERTRAAGCNGHLTKPIQLPEFLGVLSSISAAESRGPGPAP